MGSRRLRPMTAADLSLLPEPCARCTFWEASLTDLAAPVDHLDRRSIKAEWAEQVTRHWGYCGVLAYQDDAVIGHLSMAPAMYVPRLSAFATTPVSADAAVIMSAQVIEEFRGRGIGRQLVQSAASLVARRDIRALEAIGTYTDGPSCMLPTGWLEAVGFQVVRPHADHPTAADESADHRTLAARSRRRLEPADRPGRAARRLAGAGGVRADARGLAGWQRCVGSRARRAGARRCRGPGSGCRRSASRRGRTA